MAEKTERFRKFHISEIKERNYNLDIFWLKEENERDNDLREPEEIAMEALSKLEDATNNLKKILKVLSGGG